ncbi:hypothetical protein [Adhaeribacter pallidiroseus]|uniref:HTTM domain-containing protein n=1 Tax=Adhaeribacter pallidiroseus TaxID=2072847 RepID=A0A369QRT1_9BACT|nr:hypothetical protein [Adhaeribacter pallidiroseus]RDC66026.1 hypothetical protein AHMF7616_04657 [Adhaeribacter pallidiroseus]
MSLSKKVLDKYDFFVFDSFKLHPNQLALYRILYCVFTFLFYGIPNYVWIGKSPDYLFTPPHISLAHLFDGFPGTLFFTVLNVLIVVLYFVLLFGWNTKVTSLLLFFLLLIGQSFSFSFGKIDHTIIWLIIPLIMAFSGWGNAYSVDAAVNKKSEVNAWAISLMALLLGFAMFTASLPKIMEGWLSFDSQASRSHLLFNYLYWERRPLLLEAVLQVKSLVFWELFDYLTVIFEFGFLLAILNPTIFRLFVIAAVIFHISVFLTFGILFTSNLLTYLIFINWAIFDSLFKSNKLNTLASRIFTLRNLVVCISLVSLYSLIAIVLNSNFKFPSVLRLFISTFNIHVDNLNTYILFTISLFITIASVITYFQKNSIVYTQQKRYKTVK